MKSLWEYQLEHKKVFDKRRRELEPLIEWVKDAIGDEEDDAVGVQLLQMLTSMLPAER